jgi:ribosomal protein S18 acetylase RimI-like enzyme
MSTRPLTVDDKEILRELWEEFEAALPPPPVEQESWDAAWRDLSEHIERGIALLAEEDGQPVGFVTGSLDDWGPTTLYVTDLYVRPEHQGRGLGKALLRDAATAARERGFAHVLLDVALDNRYALQFYGRLGFREVSKIMHVPVDTLLERTAESTVGESFGAVHVQTDDAGSVERAVAQFGPRVGRASGWTVAPAQNGWTRVSFEPFDRDVQVKLARELSDRSGAVVVSLAVEEGAVVRFLVYERGRMVDEYLSVPEYYGQLPPGDALALRANPTVLARLTGAVPARVRAVARTADTPAELPAAPELYASIADLMGLQP